MDDNTVTVLLVEDNADDAYLIRRALAETQAPFAQLEHVSRLSEGMERLSQGGIDLVLLDLSLPDSHGFNSFSTLHAQAPHVPVVLLTGIEDETLAVQAAREGAQDYLMKSQVDGRLLARSIRYAVERHRLLMESEQQALENARLYQDLESSKEEMAVVDGVARIMTSTLETHQVYQDFALEMKKLVDFERATITSVDTEAGVLIVNYVYGHPHPVRDIGTVLPLAGSQTQRVVETSRTVIRPDLRDRLTFIDDQENIDQGLLSSIAVPLISKGRAFGGLILRCTRVNAYGQREQAILERLASQVAPAIENAQLYQDLQTSIEEMEVGDKVAAIITSTLEIDQVYEMFAMEVKKLADFDRIVISIASPEADEYTITYYYGLPVPERYAGVSRKLKGTYVEKAMHDRKSVCREYTGDMPRQGDRSRFNAGLCTGITIPLIARSKVIGTMTLDSCKSGTYGQRERIVLERLASQIAPAIENARLFQETLRVQESLRESEARFRQLYDEAPVGYQEIDAEGVISRVNHTELEMLGYAAQEMLGQPAWKFIVEENVPEVTSADGPARLRQPGQNCERTFRRKDGATIPTLVESRPLLNEDGKLVGLRCTIQDITERKHTEEQLQESNRLASIGELAAGVAHEINNPLTSILGFSQILLDESLPSSVKEDLQKIYFSAQRASKIVQNLLSFARKHHPEKRLIELTPVLERALDLKSFDFKTGNIEVICQLAGSLPHVMADEFQLIQVMLNILNNAQQASQESNAPGRLIIRTARVKDRIRISVSDNGPGIPPEHLSKIFQPFFTTKSVGAGNGLGLSICYGIVQQHYGVLWAESNPAKGSTFHMELPIARPNAESEEVQANLEAVSSYAKHLLVVDDEPHIRDLLARALGQQRYTVDLAGDGQEAWRKLQSRSYDCIIMDLKMPFMSGEELYRLISEAHPDLARKSIFMTGDTVTPETQAFVARVSGPTLSKPFDLEELRGHIQTLLRE